MKFSGFLLLTVRFPGFPSHSDRISTFILKNIFVMKNVTDLHKTVKIDMDPRLSCKLKAGELLF